MTTLNIQGLAGQTAVVHQYRFNGYCLDIARHCLYGKDGKPKKLNYRAFDTLLTLVENRGQTLSKQFLMDTVWQRTFVEDNNLNQAISGIRKALNDSKSNSQFIKTYPGKGYSFIAQVECIYDSPLAKVESQDGVDAAIDDMPVASSLGLGNFFSHFNSRHLSFLLFTCLIVVVSYFSAQSSGLLKNTDSQNLVLEQPIQIAEERIQDVIADSVAVLPLELSGEGVENDALAAGFQNELIKQLAKVKGINLISKEGLLTPEVQHLSHTELGRILRAQYLITGSVSLIDSNAIISVQMFNSSNGIILWADTFSVLRDRLPEMYTLYNDIALGIAEVLEIEVKPAERLQILNQETSSFEAYRYNLAASKAYYSLDYLETYRLSRKALSLDPDYVDALTLFSKVNVALTAAPLEGMSIGQHKQLAFEAAQRLVTLFPDNPEGYLLKTITYATDRNWEGALIEVEKLYSMNVPLSELHFIAPLFISLGDFDSAINILEANLQVEPLNGFGRGFLITAYESAGERMKARLEYDLGEELTPVWWGDTVNVFVSLGRKEEVTDINELVISEDVRSTLISLKNGDVKTVEEDLKFYLGNSYFDPAELVYFAAFAASINDHETALNLMGQAMEEQTLSLNWYWLPVFSETIQQPGFRELLDKYGMLDYWEKNGASEYMGQWAYQ